MVLIDIVAIHILKKLSSLGLNFELNLEPSHTYRCRSPMNGEYQH